MRAVSYLLNALVAQRGHLFPWLPVLFGAGIGLFFLLRVEPGSAALVSLGLVAAGLVAAARWAGPRISLLFVAAFLVVAGFLAAEFRSYSVAAPQLGFRYYGPIEGRVISIDRSQSDKLRLTLDQVRLAGMRPGTTPWRVRVSLHGDQSGFAAAPGMTVMLTGHLSAPQGPVEPGGFDFRRMAWFRGLGAVGYTRTPVLALENPAGGSLWLYRKRMQISAALQAAIPGDPGAFAAAILTGDRSAMDRSTLVALRASNLAHLLAISGLHMGLLTGFVFAMVRFGLALIPWVALRWPVRKIAAVLALAAGAAYLAMSGGNVATERAFVMVAVMLVAVLLGRRAITLRAVALAALIVLIRRPEALTGPGFQMSFAATTALVAVFGAMRGWTGWSLPKILRPVAAVAISSAVAGAATAPFAAAHFNQISHYGLLANLLSVPVMGTVVIPAAVLSALLYPFGLASAGLAIMHAGIRWILMVAEWVSGLDGAVSYVSEPSALVLPILSIGALWLILWQGRARWAGPFVVIGAFVIWGVSARPPLLISQNGGLIGLMGAQGRALSKPRGAGFAARSWLENDGDAGTSQDEAFARPGFTGKKGHLTFRLGGIEFVQLSGRGARDRLNEACAGGRWVILSARPDKAAQAGTEKLDAERDCRLIDRAYLAQSGPLALWPQPGQGITVIGVRDLVGERLWNTPQLQRRFLAQRSAWISAFRRITGGW